MPQVAILRMGFFCVRFDRLTPEEKAYLGGPQISL